jgi:hypothetical protein
MLHTLVNSMLKLKLLGEAFIFQTVHIHVHIHTGGHDDN